MEMNKERTVESVRSWRTNYKCDDCSGTGKLIKCIHCESIVDCVKCNASGKVEGWQRKDCYFSQWHTEETDEYRDGDGWHTLVGYRYGFQRDALMRSTSN
jgi:hypothetical protein